MKSVLRRRVAVILPALGLITVALAPPGVSQQPTDGSLRVTPSTHYVGGQALRFQGNIGASGVRTIKIQAHLGRAGDDWESVDGFRGRTTANGSFDFVFRAPGMSGISYRVAAGRLHTRGLVFDAHNQDLVLTAIDPIAGQDFQIEVDTTPVIRSHPDLVGLPAFPGRSVTLQKRGNGDQWTHVAEGVTDGQGDVSFTVDEPSAGTVVYRAVQGDVTSGGNAIGWFPSFPTYVEVVEDPSDLENPTDPRGNCSGFPTGDAAGPTASGRYKWGPSLFDFAWVAGESLTSKPYRGTRKRGRWIDHSDGSGRVNKNNGGLMLDSKRSNDCGPGDFGTTRATLQGNAQTYGRWEVRLRLKSDEKGDRDYRTVVELVPEKRADYDCGAHNITLAEMSPHRDRFSFGANAGSRKWTGTKTGVAINNTPQNFAVEVAKKHVTWFFKGRPVGTVKSAAASSDVPMTLRLSLEGAGQQEMNRTELISDWQRAWPLKLGKQVRSGKSLRKSRYSAPPC